MTEAKTATTERRSQEERSKTMRKRLIKATIECLALEGYANTSLSRIVTRAGVSRGAQVHHYASKNELILDAALYLMHRAYRQFGDVLLNIADEDNRLRAMVKTVWEVIYNQPSANAFLELLIACQHDKTLADVAKNLNAQIMHAMQDPVDHYFEARSPQSESPVDMLRALVIYMCGLASSRVLMDQQQIDQQIELWHRLISHHVIARKGITKPPRPPNALTAVMP